IDRERFVNGGNGARANAREQMVEALDRYCRHSVCECSRSVDLSDCLSWLSHVNGFLMKPILLGFTCICWVEFSIAINDSRGLISGPSEGSSGRDCIAQTPR